MNIKIHNRKGQLIIVSLLVLITLFFWFAGQYYFNAKKAVTLSPSPNTKIIFGVSTGDSYYPDKVIAEVTAQTTVRVPKGTYSVMFSGSGFKDKLDRVTIDKKTSITTPTLDLTDEKLAQILSIESSSIHKVVFDNVSAKEYKISVEKMFVNGAYYGARLEPLSWFRPNGNTDANSINPSNTKDVLRIVLEKKDDTWVVVAKPSIIFYKKDYPQIPSEIISEVDSFGYY